MGLEQNPRRPEVEPADQHYQEVTHERAEDAREKRDGFHFTRNSFDKDQEAFEKASRIRDRAEGVVEGSLYSHDNVRARADNERENAVRARELNTRRTILDRLMGRNKMTPDDFLRDEADRMNAVTDNLTTHKQMFEGERMSPQEAHDQIAQSKEFMPNKRSEIMNDGEQKAVAKLIARMKDADPMIEFSLNNGQANPLIDFIDTQNLGMEEHRELSRAASTLIRQKMDSSIRSLDAASLINLLRGNAQIIITKELIDGYSDSMFRLKEVREGLERQIHEGRSQNAKELRLEVERRANPSAEPTFDEGMAEA